MNPSSKAIVIGGGIIGLFTAWRLRDAGFAVTILERDEAPRSASWAAGGILSPLPPWQAHPAVWALAQQSLAEYPAICAELAEATGIDPEWTPSGLWVQTAADDESPMQWCASQGLGVHRQSLRSAAVTELGVLLPWVAQVRSPRLLKALRSYLEMRGVQMVQGAEVAGFESHAGRITRVKTHESSNHAADAFVVTAGAWSAPLLEALRYEPNIVPVRGQMLLLRDVPTQLTSIILAGDRYLIPRRDGSVLVGSTVEQVGFDEQTTGSARESLFHFARQWLPAISAAHIATQWAGLRPGTTDGVPLIEALPDVSNGWINSGHYRNGITLAPASAQLLMQRITG